MSPIPRTLIAATILTGVASSDVAQAQQVRRLPGGRIIIQGNSDRFDHDRNRDRGRRQDLQYLLPELSDNPNSGRYYMREGRYYYEPSSRDRRGGRVSPQRFEYGGYSHIDDLATRLESIANNLCLDMYYNYRDNRGFRETYAEAYHILEIATYVHDAEHRKDRREIRRRIGGLDELFHHVERDVAHWHRHHHRQIGSEGIHRKMRAMETIIHHIMYDVGVGHEDAHGHGHDDPRRPGIPGRAPRPR